MSLYATKHAQGLWGIMKALRWHGTCDVRIDILPDRDPLVGLAARHPTILLSPKLGSEIFSSAIHQEVMIQQKGSRAGLMIVPAIKPTG